MRIQGLRVDNFGIWSELEIDNLPASVTVFYGPNETGKSTLMQFIRSVFYGFSLDCKERWGTPDGLTSRFGGSLTVAVPEGQFRVSRHLDPHQGADHPGHIKVTAISGSRHLGHTVTSLISSIDESVFQNVFAVGLSEMQQLGTLSDTQAAERLYSLSTGTDHVSLVDVMRHLQAARKRLVTSNKEQVANATQGRIAYLLARRDRLRQKIDELSSQSDRWAELYGRLHAMDREVQELERRRDRLRQEITRSETALRVRPQWEQWQTLNDQIEAFGALPDLAPDILGKLATLNEKIVSTQRQHDELAESRAALKQRADQLPSSDALWRQSARIRVIAEQRSWIASLEHDVQRLETQLEETDFEVQAEQEKVGLTAPGSGARNKRVTRQLLAALKKPAQDLKRKTQKLETAKAEAAAYRGDVQRNQKQVAELLGNDFDADTVDDDWNLASLTEQASATVGNLQRFVQLDEVYQQQRSELEAVRARRNDLLANQLLPIRVLSTLGLFFTGGALFVFCGLFGYTFAFQPSSRWMMVLIGLMVIGTSVVMKLLLERSSLDALDACEDECELADKQIRGIHDERIELKKNIPPGDGTPTNRLLEAEARLAKLEKLLPIDSECRLMATQAEQLEEAESIATKAMNESRRRWEVALRRQGLAPTLSPTQLKEMISNNSTITRLQRRHQRVLEELEAARRQYDVIQNQIQELITSAHLDPVSNSALDQLDQLSDAVAKQDEVQETRESLKRQSRQLRRDQEMLNRTLHQLQARRSTLIGSTGAEDEAELERIIEQREKLHELREQRHQVIESVGGLIDAPVDEQELRQEMLERLTDDLPDKLQDQKAGIQRVEGRLKELIERRGKISQEIEFLARDRSLSETQLALNLAERRLQRGLQDWKTLSAVTQMIESVYKKYEKDRQPTTLNEASTYLERLTEGHFVRIWTPLADNILMVDDAQGMPVSIDKLSRGTREQVFLSLRLALVSDYARRGIRMPLVLDDVLVNFDVDRTVAAAHVLRDFATQGHQLLVFTCHIHIMNIFERIGVEIREIPRQQSTRNMRHVVHEITRSTPVAKPVAKPVSRKEPEHIAEPNAIAEPATVANATAVADPTRPLAKRATLVQHTPVATNRTAVSRVTAAAKTAPIATLAPETVLPSRDVYTNAVLRGYTVSQPRQQVEENSKSDPINDSDPISSEADHHVEIPNSPIDLGKLRDEQDLAQTPNNLDELVDEQETAKQNSHAAEHEPPDAPLDEVTEDDLKSDELVSDELVSDELVSDELEVDEADSELEEHAAQDVEEEDEDDSEWEDDEEYEDNELLEGEEDEFVEEEEEEIEDETDECDEDELDEEELDEEEDELDGEDEDELCDDDAEEVECDVVEEADGDKSEAEELEDGDEDDEYEYEYEYVEVDVDEDEDEDELVDGDEEEWEEEDADAA